MRVDSINNKATKVYEHQVTKLMTSMSRTRRNKRNQQFFFPHSPSKSRYLVKLPHQDPELLALHNKGPHWSMIKVFSIYFIFVETLSAAW
jgi:hypothetical protein